MYANWRWWHTHTQAGQNHYSNVLKPFGRLQQNRASWREATRTGEMATPTSELPPMFHRLLMTWCQPCVTYLQGVTYFYRKYKILKKLKKRCVLLIAAMCLLDIISRPSWSSYKYSRKRPTSMVKYKPHENGHLHTYHQHWSTISLGQSYVQRQHKQKQYNHACKTLF